VAWLFLDNETSLVLTKVMTIRKVSWELALVILSPLALIAGMLFFQVSGWFPPLLFYAIWAIFSPMVLKRRFSLAVYKDFGFSLPISNPRAFKVLLLAQVVLSLLLISFTYRLNLSLFLLFLSLMPLFLISPLVEEVYWRGALMKVLDQLKDRVLSGKKMALIGYFSFLFWLYHFLLFGLFGKQMWLSPLMFVLSFGAGFVWSIFYLKTKSLLYSYLSHLLADVLLVLFLEPVIFGGS
jgi:membrane protease YdiL (CAAX protease family)